MARGGQRQNARRGGQRRRNGGPAGRDNEGIIPVLARTVREVESAVGRGSAMPSVRAKFQVIGLLAREERARAAGLQVGSVSLQDYIVHRTTTAAAPRATVS